MFVIVGLGNPGKKYENTKHNIGFITIDYLAQTHGIKVNKIKHKALLGEGLIGSHRVLLVKPQTYMNLSGQSVREIMSYYKVEIENLLVIYDDIDIGLGSLRIRKKGSGGTHNGMKSIIYDLGDDGFPRFRIGIGKNQHGDLANFVLSGFSGDEKKDMEEAVMHTAKAVEAFVENGIDFAMNAYNMKNKKEEKTGEEQ